MRTSLALVGVILTVAAACSGCGSRSGKGAKSASEPGIRLTEPEKAGADNATAEDALKSFMKLLLSNDQKGMAALRSPECRTQLLAIFAATGDWRQSGAKITEYEYKKLPNDVFEVKNTKTGQPIKLGFTAVNGKYLFEGLR
jgi:hypothetical protein